MTLPQRKPPPQTPVQLLLPQLEAKNRQGLRTCQVPLRAAEQMGQGAVGSVSGAGWDSQRGPLPRSKHSTLTYKCFILFNCGQTRV